MAAEEELKKTEWESQKSRMKLLVLQKPSNEQTFVFTFSISNL